MRNTHELCHIFTAAYTESLKHAFAIIYINVFSVRSVQPLHHVFETACDVSVAL